MPDSETLIADIFRGPRVNISPNSSWTTLGFVDQWGSVGNLFTIRQPWTDPMMSSSRGSKPQWMTRFRRHTSHQNVLGDGAIMRSNTESSDASAPVSPASGPLRLYDCETEVLKDQKSYFRETNSCIPSYLVVSQVWGNNQVQMKLPTVEWTVPISEKAKWEAILGYCKTHDIKWLWMDVLCINQDKSNAADLEKAVEIPKMGEYYRGATACLVVPQKYTSFSGAYRRLVEILNTVTDAGGPSPDNIHRVWESLMDLEKVMDDSWLQRMWTFQELLLPKKHVLLDGQELRLGDLRRVVDWYFKVVRNGSLRRPPGGRRFAFVSEAQGNIVRGWTPEKLGWLLKEGLEMGGRVDLIRLVSHTRDKRCSFQVDRLFGLYGLLGEEEKVSIETKMMPSQGSNDTPSDVLALELTWKRIISKVILAGRVWPLLHDVMNMDPTTEDGTNWIPQITAFHRRADSILTYPETLNHRNAKSIVIDQDGLHMSVRVVGQVIGFSDSIGDGKGEINRVITCTWALAARGYNIEPIANQMKEGIAWSDGVQTNDVEKVRRALNSALQAKTLSDCFRVVERFDLRTRLTWAPCLSGWDRTILAMQADGQMTPLVLLAWTHRQLPPIQCWILDVTDDPIASVQRWVVANKVGPNAFRKIGSVQSFPTVMEERLLAVTEIVFT